MIVGLILGGLIVDLGCNPTHERIGFRYWKDPGAFAAYFTQGDLGKFLGFFTNLVRAAGAYTGAESIAIAAAEVKNPRVATAKAIKRLFWRIIIFYFGAVLVAGMLVPSNDPSLLQSTGTAASSPFVLAFDRFGRHVDRLIFVADHGFRYQSVASCDQCRHSAVDVIGCKFVDVLCQQDDIWSGFTRPGSKLFSENNQERSSPCVFGVRVVVLWSSVFVIIDRRIPCPQLAFKPDCFVGVLNTGTLLTNRSSYICWACICMTYLRFKGGIEAQGYDRKDFQSGPFSARSSTADAS